MGKFDVVDSSISLMQGAKLHCHVLLPHEGSFVIVRKKIRDLYVVRKNIQYCVCVCVCLIFCAYVKGQKACKVRRLAPSLFSIHHKANSTSNYVDQM